MGASAHKPKLQGSSKIKLLLVGKPGVGKTALIGSFQENYFKEEYEATTGCNLISLDVALHGRNLQLLVMDALADADLSLSCRLKSIQNTETLAIVFDISDRESWTDVSKKIKIVKENSYQNNALVLVGNKSDLDRRVDREEIEDFVKKCSEFHIEYFECSAKNGGNVKTMFTKALEIGYFASKARWERVKIVLFVALYSVAEESSAGFSWGNLCEALPAMVKRKKSHGPILSLLPPEVIKRLITFI